MKALTVTRPKRAGGRVDAGDVGDMQGRPVRRGAFRETERQGHDAQNQAALGIGVFTPSTV